MRVSKSRLMKIAVVSAFIAFAVLLAALGSARAQSRFVERRLGEAVVFIDRYIEPAARHAFSSGLAEALGFLVESGLADQAPRNGPVAFFAADRHYGVVSANDPLVARRLKGRPSSDFALFRSIGANFYANELVARSVASQDGAYVFVNVDEDWRASVIHAYAHAVAIANAPDFVRAAHGLDQRADPQARRAFRFVDEVFALLASDIEALRAARGGMAEAWKAYPEESPRRYAAPDSVLHAREAEVLAATYDYPQRTVDFYEACNGFAVWYLVRFGREALLEGSRLFYAGDYAGFDELFRKGGGLEASLMAWKGDASVPR